MSLLIGEYLSAVTTGNRISIPRKFRRSLAKEGLILTRGYEGCLILVTATQFNNLTKDVAEQPFTWGEVRETTRFLLGSAHEISPDAQGRFVIPESLYEYGHIQNEVAFLGLGSWIEIWDSQNWQKHKLLLDKQAGQIAQRLGKNQKAKQL